MENNKILRTFEEVYGFKPTDRIIVDHNLRVQYKRLSSALKKDNPMMVYEVTGDLKAEAGAFISLKEEGETSEGLVTRLELSEDLDSIIDLRLGRTNWIRPKRFRRDRQRNN